MSEAYSYNGVGELTRVTPSGVSGVGVVQYGYDPSGRVSTVTRNGTASPTSTLVSYDAAGQVSSLEHSSGSTVVDAYGIIRDVLGNPTVVSTTAATASGTTTSSALYGYDSAGRLRSECYPATGEVCVAKSPRNVYTYDLVGNRATESARTVVGTKATTIQTEYAYDAADQLLTESVGGLQTVSNTWTPNGVLASATTPAGATVYTSDLMDELTSLTLPDGSTVGFTHDVAGNRTSRTVDGVLDASWVWDELSSLPVRIGEYNGAGVLTTAWLPDPTSATGSPLAESTGGTASWMLSDPFLNVAASVSMTGTVSGTKTLDAFGETRTTATGTLATSPMGFAGQYLDDATGMYDMRARDYNPASGRFTAMDAVAVPTGTPYFAAYTYGYGNPLMFTDPTGLFCIPISVFGSGDCRSIGERISPKNDLNAGFVDGASELVVGTGYAFSSEGFQAGWSSFQQDRQQNGTWTAILNGQLNGAGAALAVDDMTGLASCGTGPVFCTQHDFGQAGAHAGLTLATTEILLTASLFGPEAGYCKALVPTVTRTAVAAAKPTIMDLLMPGGSAIGKMGTDATIREVAGGLPQAQVLFRQLTEGGRVVAQTQSLTRVEVPGGGFVQLRTVMSKSPITAATIDVNVPGLAIRKIKFNP